MKGELTVAGEEYQYSEEQTLNGKLNWGAVWGVVPADVEKGGAALLTLSL